MNELNNKVGSVVNIEIMQVGIRNGACLGGLALLAITVIIPPTAVFTIPAAATISLGATAADRALEVAANVVQDKQW